MTDLGFPKDMRVFAFDQLDTCKRSVNLEHNFKESQQIMKVDESNGKKEVVMLSQYYCTRCLTHVYFEVTRSAMEEMTKECLLGEKKMVM